MNESLNQVEEEGRKTDSERRVKKSFLSYFKKNKSRLSFGEKAEALYGWLTSGQLSTRDKALVIGALVYFINPLDAIPDLTPFLGFSDDLGVVYLVYNYLQNRSIEETKSDKQKDDEKKG